MSGQLDYRPGSLVPTCRLATCVVMYRPLEEHLITLFAHLEFCELVIVVDNTDQGELSERLAGFTNLRYRAMGHNVGVATALNVGATISMSQGFEWILMLDQDSVLSEQAYSMLRRAISTNRNMNVGMFSLTPVSREVPPCRQDLTPKMRRTTYAITSGSALSAHAYKTCGAFEDKLFIDHIDTEYCLRLKMNGYSLIELTNASLNHSLGERVTKRLLGIYVTFVSHAPFRTYYYARNGLYVASKYFPIKKTVLISVMVRLFKEVIKIAFLHDNKKLRLQMLVLGVRDRFAGRYGSFNQELFQRSVSARSLRNK